MSQATAPPKVPFPTVADLLHRLGDIPADRIRLHPAPGTATVKDVIAIEAKENRLCELIDGVLVEKTMGYEESYLAQRIAFFLMTSIEQTNLGLVTGPDGTIRLVRGQVRIPDVAFFTWERFPDPENVTFDSPIPNLVPDLAIEVLSSSNTRREMERKLREYFAAGVRLVWYVDPKTRTVRVYTSPEAVTEVGEGQTLEGGDVLPGFNVPLARLFARPGRGRRG